MAINSKVMSRAKWNSLPSMFFHNVCRDFSIEAKVLKKVPSGYRVAIDHSMGPDSIGYTEKIAKIEGDKVWLRFGGSVCNNYVKRL